MVAKSGFGDHLVFSGGVANNRTLVALLEKEPSVYVGTCHSFKGGEADVSVIFPDLSSRGLQAWLGTDRNSVLRLFYVALTRAREAVVLASAATGAAVW